jgi:hypothetical protein
MVISYSKMTRSSEALRNPWGQYVVMQGEAQSSSTRHTFCSSRLCHTSGCWMNEWMYVWGAGRSRPLHRDPQWSIVLPLQIIPPAILHFEWTAGSYLRLLVAGFPPVWPGFEPRSGYLGFVVEDKVVLEAGFDWVLLFPQPIFIPPIAPQSPSSIIWGWYNRPIVAIVPSELSLLFTCLGH